MTEKQKNALEKIITALPAEYRENYREVAEYAISLGYTPSVKGVREDYADFTGSKTKKKILKINTDPKFSPCLSIKFYALPNSEYSAYFQKAIDDRILTWKRLKYKFSCFGCGKCDGTEGYIITLPDNEKGFLCGFGLLPLPLLNAENITEVKEALRIQHEYFINQAK